MNKLLLNITLYLLFASCASDTVINPIVESPTVLLERDFFADKATVAPANSFVIMQLEAKNSGGVDTTDTHLNNESGLDVFAFQVDKDAEYNFRLDENTKCVVRLYQGNSQLLLLDKANLQQNITLSQGIYQLQYINEIEFGEGPDISPIIFMPDFQLLKERNIVANLENVERYKYISCSNVNGIDINNANLSRLVLNDVKFENSNLQYVNFGKSQLNNARFINSSLTGCQFDSSSLVNSIFRNSGAINILNFEYANLDSTDFSNQLLRFPTFFRSSVKNANFNNTRFFRAQLNLTDLSSSNIDKAIFWESNLVYVKMDTVSALGTDFCGAVIQKGTFLEMKVNAETKCPPDTTSNTDSEVE